MLRKISLKEDSPSGKELILPVTPASWQGEAGRKASSLTMHTVGAVNLPGSRVLLDEELDYLPAGPGDCRSLGLSGGLAAGPGRCVAGVVKRQVYRCDEAAS